MIKNIQIIIDLYKQQLKIKTKNAKSNSINHRQFCGDVIMKKEYK